MDCKTFVDTYFHRDGNRQAFLKLPRLLTSKVYSIENETSIFKPGMSKKIISFDDGGVEIPVMVVRIRFMNAIMDCKRGDNEHIVCLLSQYLTDNAIRELFPEVWSEHVRYINKRNLTTFVNAMRKANKDKTHREVVGVTGPHSMRQYARMSIV